MRAASRLVPPLILALGALPALGFPLPGVPVTDAPTGAARLLLPLAAFLLLLGPLCERGGRPEALLAQAARTLALLPPLAAIWIAVPAGAATLPWAGAVLLAGLAFVCVALPLRRRGQAAIALLVAPVALGLADRAGAEWLPPSLDLLGAPPAAGGREAAARETVFGLRRGAPERVEGAAPALAEDGGDWRVRAQRERQTVAAPLWLLLGSEAQRVAPGEGPRPHPALPGSALPGAERRFDSWLDLEAFDLVLADGSAWPAHRGERAARALADWVAAGGVLFLPPDPGAWPPVLASVLREARRAFAAGREGRALSQGFGRVVPAGDAGSAAAWVAEAGWGRPLRTIFDRARFPPAAPLALPRWEDEPARRRVLGGLVLAWLGLLLLLHLARPRPGVLAATLLIGAAGLTAAGSWLYEPGPAARFHALRVQLGVSRGRAVDALLISAGPSGWRGRVRFRGGGAVGLLGARLDEEGRVVVAPGALAWALREQGADRARGAGRPAREAGWLLGLLEGEVDPKRVRYERGLDLRLRIEGAAVPEAWRLLVRAPR